MIVMVVEQTLLVVVRVTMDCLLVKIVQVHIYLHILAKVGWAPLH